MYWKETNAQLENKQTKGPMGKDLSRQGSTREKINQRGYPTPLGEELPNYHSSDSLTKGNQTKVREILPTISQVIKVINSRGKITNYQLSDSLTKVTKPSVKEILPTISWMIS